MGEKKLILLWSKCDLVRRKNFELKEFINKVNTKIIEELNENGRINFLCSDPRERNIIFWKTMGSNIKKCTEIIYSDIPTLSVK